MYNLAKTKKNNLPEYLSSEKNECTCARTRMHAHIQTPVERKIPTEFSNIQRCL